MTEQISSFGDLIHQASGIPDAMSGMARGAIDRLSGKRPLLDPLGDTTSGGGDAISIDPDGLLDFARKLEDKAAEMEEGVAAKRAKVEEAFQRESRLYTKDGKTAPVFQPLGDALAAGLDKAESNVKSLTATLRNDARLLCEVVAEHEEAEERAARGFDSMEARPRG